MAMVASVVAIIVSVILGQMISMTFALSMDLRLGAAVFVGALVYGCTYGAVTHVGLRRLLKPSRLLSVPPTQPEKGDTSATASLENGSTI